MKKKIVSLMMASVLILSTLLLNSCVFFDTDDLFGTASNGSNSGLGGVTNITVNGGENYDITVNSGEQPNVLAAAKSVLSAVSIITVSERDNSYGYTISQKGSSSGSGVIYKLDKEKGNAYIITNFHVVYDAYCNTSNKICNTIKVYLYGQEYERYAIPATYVGGSPNYDIAILKIENSEVLMKSSATAVTVADSDDLSILEPVIAIGNPRGIGLSATLGVVCVDSENIKISMVYNGSSKTVELRCVRIDAAVNSGNSGGGLFNDRGDLVGIVNAKLVSDSGISSSSDAVENIGYAIPSNVASAIADNIIDYCDGTDKENVYRCMLGITVEVADAKAVYDKETGKVGKDETVIISEVLDTGAAKGILKTKDVINSITIDGELHEVTRIHHVIDSMLNARVGSEVVMNVTRDGKAMDINIPITEKMLTAY